MDRQAGFGLRTFHDSRRRHRRHPQFHDLNNHHYFSYPQDADCLYFGLTSAGMGGSWKTLHTAVDAWDDYDLNQQWTQIHNMLGSHAIMIMSPEFMKHLCGVTSTLSASLSHRIRTTRCRMISRLPCICVTTTYALRQPVFYQAKTATVNGTTIDLANRTSLRDVPKRRGHD
jgi:hypothetical protein